MRKRFLLALLALTSGSLPTFSVSAQEAAPAPKAAQEAADPGREIMQLIQQNKLEDATSKLDSWETDNIAMKLNLRQMLAGNLARQRQTDKAKVQYEALLTEFKAALESGKLSPEQLSMPMQALISNRMQQDNPEAAATWAREQVAEMSTIFAKLEGSAGVAAEGAIEALVADFRAAFNLSEESDKVEEQLKRLRHALDNEKEERLRNSLLMSWVNMRMSRINRLINEDATKAVADADSVLNELGGSGDPTKDPQLFSQLLRIRTNLAQRLMRANPKVAKEQLDSLKAMLDGLAEADERVKALAENAKRNLDRMAQSLEMELKRAELIGQKAIPLQADAFVNGEPLKDEDLKGKVVLLDFWAVWCGPCIATFPHLREWQEKYADKGLVIIGVTNYYKYDWDDEQKRIKSVPDFAPEDERKALVRFAEHHELKHRFMVTPSGSTFAKDYAVTGIPQAVLIDKEGNIRMIKVGSGDANAQALDQLIKELLGVEEGAQ